MLRRLLTAAGVVAVAAPALTGTACGGKVVVESGSGVGGQGGNPDTTVTSGIFPVATGTSGSGCTLTGSAASGGQLQTTECIPPLGDGCPTQYQATMYIVPSLSCGYVVSVDCGPVPQGDTCCYMVTEEGGGCVGRPFLVDDRARTASVERADRGWSLGVLAPDTTGLDPEVRRALAAAWAADALLEHASIAAFSRFSLELLAVGGPADLVAAAHQAALDEVRHARICFALAQGYAGAPLGPSAFPFDGSITLSADLASFAAATAREGCIGETLSAILAAEQLARATDPAVRRALSAIAEDESRHAELAWRTVAWAIERGGDAVRSAVAAVLEDTARYVPTGVTSTAIPPGILGSHGRLDAAATREAMIRALDEVVRPCFASLLQARPRAELVASAAA
ncbi:MAG: ferritin-like domain-containing protein [Byssovorax sp.]